MALRDRFDRLRDAGWRAIAGRDGKLTTTARRMNDILGRPLAPADELADRRAFERGYGTGDTPAAPAPAAAARTTEAAPVIVYVMDKQKRDLAKVTDVLEASGIPYKVMSLEGDEAAQAAVRRDAKGARLPLCFIAGECVGGRTELVNLAQSGELKRRVFGA